MIELFVIGSLACWRLSRLISGENGPFYSLARFRTWVGVYNDATLKRVGRTELARMILCIKCLSLWVGWALAVAYALYSPEVETASGVFLAGCVLSAGALLVDVGYKVAEKLGL